MTCIVLLGIKNEEFKKWCLKSAPCMSFAEWMYSSESAGPSADVGFRWADLACSCIFTDPYVQFLFFLFAHLNQQIGGSETWGSSLNIRLFCSHISTWRKWRNVKHQYTLADLIVSDTIREKMFLLQHGTLFSPPAKIEKYQTEIFWWTQIAHLSHL